MSEQQPKLNIFRSLDPAEFAWQADLSDALYGDNSLPQQYIDGVLLNGKVPRAYIVTHGEVDRFLRLSGIPVQRSVLLELNDKILNGLPDTNKSPITDMATDPVRIVENSEGPTRIEFEEGIPGLVKRNQRTRYSLRMGRSPVINRERMNAIEIVAGFCESTTLYPANVWLKPDQIEGFEIGRAGTLGKRSILSAADVWLNTHARPSTVMMSEVQSDPSLN